MPRGREKRDLGVVPGETFDAVCWSERDAAVCLLFTWYTHEPRAPPATHLVPHFGYKSRGYTLRLPQGLAMEVPARFDTVEGVIGAIYNSREPCTNDD
jgi:hypothetical protein